jgi:hypothetical protein
MHRPDQTGGGDLHVEDPPEAELDPEDLLGEEREEDDEKDDDQEPSRIEIPDIVIGDFIGGVECTVPGTGTGTIDVIVLGMNFGTWVGSGEWDSAAGGIELGGSAGLFSGVQGPGTGVMSIGPVPIASSGSPKAHCIEEKVAVGVEGRCWNFGVFVQCTGKVEWETKLIPCGASVEQVALLSLAEYHHEYTTGLC